MTDMKKLSSRSAVAVLALLSISPSFAEMKEWRLDPAHSYVGFKVRHMMVSWVRGRFGGVKGTIAYDPGDLTKTQVNIEIDAASIDTRNEKRDSDLRGEEFFDVAKYPKILFVSKRVEGDPQTGLKLIGDLTMRGVTKEVALDVDGPATPVADGRGGEKTGATVSGTINRSDFGLTWNRMLEAGGVTVSDEVTIEIEAELASGGLPSQQAPPQHKNGGE